MQVDYIELKDNMTKQELENKIGTENMESFYKWHTGQTVGAPKCTLCDGTGDCRHESHFISVKTSHDCCGECLECEGKGWVPDFYERDVDAFIRKISRDRAANYMKLKKWYVREI